MKKLLLMLAIPLLSYIGQAQVGINNTDPKASLDISASDATNPSNIDGMLIPRIDDFPGVNPTVDQQGMMVYLTTTSGGNPPGFYYWDNNAGPAAWVSVTGSGSDADWYEEGTTTAPNSINDNIFTEGFVGIGQPNPISPLQISSSVQFGVRFTNSSTAIAPRGIYNTVISTSNFKFGIENLLGGTSDPSTGRITGIKNNFNSFGGDDLIGFENTFLNASGRYIRGLDNTFNSGLVSSNGVEGVNNAFYTSGTSSKGMYNYFAGNSTNYYGVENIMALGVNSTGNVYGLRNSFEGSGNGTEYGSQTVITSVGTGTKYGHAVTMSALTGGINYGYWASIPNTTTGYAGYFIGRSSFGNTTTNRYTLPAIDGTSGQVMTTDGAGQISFTNPSSDADWYEVGTTSAPNDINDNIFTLGDVAIGKITASFPLDVQSTDTRTASFRNDATSGSIIGVNNIVNSATGTVLTGISNSLTGASVGGNSWGIINNIHRTGGVTMSGLSNDFAGASASGNMWAVQNNLGGATATTQYGVINNMTGTSINAYGIQNNLGDSNGTTFGMANITSGLGAGSVYGLYTDFDGSGTGNRYGTYSIFEESGGGSKYGHFVLIPSITGGTHYGIYTDVRNTTSYAGYFIGRTSFGTGAINRYLMPTIDGTNGQVISTDGNGNLSFTTATTGTDDQTIDTFNFNILSNILTLEIEDDGIAAQTIDLSPLKDADWFVENSTNTSTNINDEIYTQGNVSIGDQNALYPFNVTTTTASITMELNNAKTGTSTATGIENNLTGPGHNKVGLNNILSGTGGTGGQIKGINNSISQNAANASFYGMFNRYDDAIGDRGYGMYNRFSSTSTFGTEVIGVDNYFDTTTVTATGLRNSFSGGILFNYGVYNTNSSAVGSDNYGMYTLFSNTGLGDHYGSYTSLTGTGSGEKYGHYITIPNTTGGAVYGIYSDVEDTTSGYAGYFLGRVSIGTITGNRYIFPTSRGTNGQIMETDASGNVSWVTPSFGDINEVTAGDGLTGGGTSGTVTLTANANNGLNVDVGDDSIQWGGTLTEDTAITQGTFDTRFNLTDSGDFIVQDNGMDAFIVEDTGEVGIGTSSPAYTLDILETGNTVGRALNINKSDNSAASTTGINLIKDSSGAGSSSGLAITLSGTGTGAQFAMSNNISNTGTDIKVSFNTIFSGSATGDRYGLRNQFSSTSSATRYGVYNSYLGVGSGDFNGLYNLFNHGSGSGTLYGTRNIFSSTSTGSKYGSISTFNTTAGGDIFGLDLDINALSNNTKYGVRVDISTSTSGTANYGIHSTVDDGDGWAGYYVGKNYVSESIGINNPSPVGRLDIIHNSLNANTPHIMLTAQNANSGTRITFNNAVETTNNWVLFARADDTSGDGALNFFNSNVGGNILRLESDGKVGIARNPTTNTLEVGGDASKATAGSWLGNSDKRLKKNILTLSGETALEKLKKLRGVTYEWNDSQTGMNRPEGIQYGFIAQDLMEVFPEKVTKDNLGFYQTAYGDYDALFVQAIKELNTKVEDLESENQQLKTILSNYKNLEARLSALEEKPNATNDVAINK